MIRTRGAGERDLPDVGHNDGALWNEIAVVNVVLLDAVGSAEWGGRAPADDFPEHRGEVRKRVAVGERGQAVVADDGIEFSLALLLDLGIHGHGEEEGGHCGNGLKSEATAVSGFAAKSTKFSYCIGTARVETRRSPLDLVLFFR